MDEPRDFTEARCRGNERLHGVARGDIDGRYAHFVTCVTEHLRRSVRILGPHVGQHDMLPYPHAPRDGLANLTGSDDGDDVFHRGSFRVERPKSASGARTDDFALREPFEGSFNDLVD